MRYSRHNVNPEKKHTPRAGYAVPFFIVLAVLTVVAFIIPLRPTQSYSEKRNLAQFPDFSVDALVSGSYFDDISTWFSDTFPGRESWLSVNASVEELHGHSDIIIHGDLPSSNNTPAVTENTAPTESGTPAETTIPVETTEPEPVVLQETTPPTDPVEEWGGLNAAEEEISLSGAIQIGDSAFTYFGYSEYTSDRYTTIVNKLAEKLKGTGVNLINAPAPTAIGVMIENEYMDLVGCEPQDEALDYINNQLDESVYAIDTVRALIAHNDEYLFYRTDHHWSALGAYYVYEQVCLALGNEPAPLDSFTEWDQGEFEGSLYYQCNQSSKLRKDNVIAYVPDSDIECKIYDADGNGFEWPMLTDMTQSKPGSKYMTFLAGDHALTILTNNDIPDAPNCVMIKDSFGNCFAPFLTQNYHKVYVVDYREYYRYTMSRFVEEYDIQDVILIPNLGATQSENVIGLLEYLLK